MESTVLILLAEDEFLIASSIESELKEAGFRVRHVSSGEDAIAALDEQEVFSGLTTDIRLGKGPDG